ncbi:Uncharacterized conserved protein [Rhodoblastus acidophilus]|uniref:Uncharacterized conserved protein n=1 Tax=Rhodoblastus acidophilus TaxID=1074 RepID=A0A212S986_RHOAC|nr:hypothetical protein CKO16_18465 [Rhodoblastus acidophilus]RAI20393.1 hypothetical protein CH337_09780 [Rhodoblastus acidophilus]SNB82015.1 Uncharacterized conserved protein [Rhodoblastus acidophilus]
MIEAPLDLQTQTEDRRGDSEASRVKISRFSWRRQPVARALLDTARLLAREQPTFGALLDRLGSRGLGLILMLMTLPALIPVPGPFGMVFGSILALLTAQLAGGARRFWLPRRLRDRPAPAAAMRTALKRALPWAARLGPGLRQGRLAWLTGARARRVCAAPMFVMAVIIALPIPLGNVAPCAAMLVSAAALIARDGLALMVGMGLSALAAAWTALLLFAGAEIAFKVWAWLPH